MPKRSNDFQRLITMLTRLLGEHAVVEESKMLTDLVSGEQREVDIYAEGILAGHAVRIGIECRDHKRKQVVGWVEEMHSKHERLPTNLVILVSSSGFTRSAVAKAESYGIKTITPTQADSDLASEVLASLCVTFSVTITAWSKVNSQVSANVPTDWLERNPHAHGVLQDNGQIQFYRSDRSPLVTSDIFNNAVLTEGLAANPELIADPTRETDVEMQGGGPMYEGEPLYAYWTADDGEPPIFVPVAMVVVRGTAKMLTPDAVNLNLVPSSEVVYDGNSFLTGTAPMADGSQARIVFFGDDDAAGQRRFAADFRVSIPLLQSETPPTG